MSQTFWGYRRENGRVGVRNHVIVLPLDDISNNAAEGVARITGGTMALPHHYGRLQFGRDLDLFFRTLIGVGSNPNVAAAVVIGIESSNWTTKVAEGIAATGKPVAMFGIERYGDFSTIERAARKAKEFVHWASELRREECAISELVVSTKCGESDTTSGLAANPTVGKVFERLVAAGASVSFGETTELTGGEDIVAVRFKNPADRERFMAMFDDYQALVEKEHADLLGSQPTQGNIIGGLTTIEEKALGNIQKIGKCMIDGVLDEAAAIPVKSGLWYMNTSSAAAEALTLWAAGGAVVHLFPTGQGNICGNPVMPVIKLSANPVTVTTMAEHIDVDVSGVLTREITLDQAADRLMAMLLRTANGRLTATEVLGHREFVLTKLYRSA